MNVLSVFLLLIFSTGVTSNKLIKQIQFEDDIVELIETAGYQSEVHKVETKDGYILKVHRIIVKKESLVPRRPVFMMHGLGSTAYDFVSTGKSLGFLLSDNGYDIWLGNARGSKHSMNHRTLNVESKEFWNFSWHEIGIYDLPAMIEHMLTTNNHTKLYYVGYSQGSTASMVLLTTYPEYNEKIIQNHMIGPAVFFKNSQSLIKVFGKMLKTYIDMMGVYKNPEYLSSVVVFSSIVCQNQTAAAFCLNLVYLCFGRTTGEPEITAAQINEGLLHVSPSIALKQGIHYSQLAQSGHFRQFDYFGMNTKYYNSSEPPDYDLTKITVPVFIYHGLQDSLIALPDVKKLNSILQNVRYFKVFENWNHLDMLYGKNAKKLLFLDLLKSISIEELN